LSIGSAGSILSIGSAGGVLSIGGAGTLRALGRAKRSSRLQLSGLRDLLSAYQDALPVHK
jgi:hypothetical protein